MEYNRADFLKLIHFCQKRSMKQPNCYVLINSISLFRWDIAGCFFLIAFVKPVDAEDGGGPGYHMSDMWISFTVQLTTLIFIDGRCTLQMQNKLRINVYIFIWIVITGQHVVSVTITEFRVHLTRETSITERMRRKRKAGDMMAILHSWTQVFKGKKPNKKKRNYQWLWEVYLL